MKKRISDIKKRFNSMCITAAVKGEQQAQGIVGALAIGFVILSLSDSASAQIAINDGRYSEACNRLLGLMESSFGALVTVAAGVGAIIASAVGGFKMAWTLVVVAVGAFILRAYVTLFFQNCGNAG